MIAYSTDIKYLSLKLNLWIKKCTVKQKPFEEQKKLHE